MPVGDRALSLLTDEDDAHLLRRFLEIVPRYLRAEVDELAVRIHPLPTIEKLFLDTCAALAADADRGAAVEESKMLLSAAFRQIGVHRPESPRSAVRNPAEGSAERREGAADGRAGSKSGPGSMVSLSSSTTGAPPLERVPERESGEGVRRLEELLSLRPVLNGRASGRPGWYRELLAMDGGDCDRLLARFAEMTRPETAALATAARALDPPGFPELLWLMEHPEALERDPLADAKRRDTQHLMLAVPPEQHGFGGYDPAKPTEFLAPQPHKVETLGVFGAGEERSLRLDDGPRPQVPPAPHTDRKRLGTQE